MFIGRNSMNNFFSKFEFSNLIIYGFKFEFDKSKLFRVQVRNVYRSQ